MATIKNLGLFFKRYDIYYEAHQIPCSIDYPLLKPVEDDIKGISYIEEYINHIKIENAFIHSFDFDTVIRFLQRRIPDYIENYLNLCEPILVNSIAKKLLGQNVKTLNLSKSDVSNLVVCFDGKSKDELAIRFREAVRSICEEIGFDVNNASYFNEEIDSLAIRVESATKSGYLCNVFMPDN